MKETFAGRIRQAIKTLSRNMPVMTSTDISIAAEIKTREDQKRLMMTIGDFCKSGELVRVGRGRYQYRGKKSNKLTIQERMWRVLRASRVVKAEDLQQMAGASESYALEWLQMLECQGIVRRLKNNKWQIVHDTIEMPKNEEKAERLRHIRLRKKEALEAINEASNAISAARAAIERMEEDNA